MLKQAPISRLEEFLTADYPKLRCYVGGTAFAGMVRRFAASNPSKPARWYAAHFPHSLSRPELAELAGLELALSEAFHAPDYPFVTFHDLTHALPHHDCAVLDIHPSAQRFTVTTNVAGLWASLRCDQPPPGAYFLEHPQNILVWRQGHNARFRLLGDEESRVFDAAREGMALGAIVEMMAKFDDPPSARSRAMVYLRGWVEAEIVSAFRFAAPAEVK